jgi:hypothetical protein
MSARSSLRSDRHLGHVASLPSSYEMRRSSHERMHSSQATPPQQVSFRGVCGSDQQQQQGSFSSCACSCCFCSCFCSCLCLLARVRVIYGHCIRRRRKKERKKERKKCQQIDCTVGLCEARRTKEEEGRRKGTAQHHPRLPRSDRSRKMTFDRGPGFLSRRKRRSFATSSIFVNFGNTRRRFGSAFSFKQEVGKRRRRRRKRNGCSLAGRGVRVIKFAFLKNCHQITRLCAFSFF